MGIGALLRIVAAWREVAAWLGLVEKPAVPGPPDPAAEHRPDRRAVPMLIVTDDGRPQARSGEVV